MILRGALPPESDLATEVAELVVEGGDEAEGGDP